MKKITFRKMALRQLVRIPVTDADRIRDKIRQYAADPASQANNVKKLQGRDGYRLRVGDWRVIFDETDTVLDIIRIGPRGSVYE